MTEFLATAFRVIDPATLTVSLVLGVLSGLLTVPTLKRISGGDPARLAFVAFAGHLVIGVPWLLMMLVTRYLEGIEAWAGWIGVIVLWVTTGSVSYLTLRLRERSR